MALVIKPSFTLKETTQYQHYVPALRGQAQAHAWRKAWAHRTQAGEVGSGRWTRPQAAGDLRSPSVKKNRDGICCRQTCPDGRTQTDAPGMAFLFNDVRLQSKMHLLSVGLIMSLQAAGWSVLHDKNKQRLERHKKIWERKLKSFIYLFSEHMQVWNECGLVPRILLFLDILQELVQAK